MLFPIVALVALSLPLSLAAPSPVIDSPYVDVQGWRRGATPAKEIDITNSTSVLTVDQSTATSLIVYHPGETTATTTNTNTDTKVADADADSESFSIVTSGTASAPQPTTTFSLLGALTTTASDSSSSSTAAVAAASTSSSASGQTITSPFKFTYILTTAVIGVVAMTRY